VNFKINIKLDELGFSSYILDHILLIPKNREIMIIKLGNINMFILNNLKHIPDLREKLISISISNNSEFHYIATIIRIIELSQLFNDIYII